MRRNHEYNPFGVADVDPSRWRAFCKEGDDDPDEPGGTSTAVKDRQEELHGMRTRLVERIASMNDPGGEDKQEVERREKEAGEMVDEIVDYLAKQESTEVKELREKIEEVERRPVSDSKTAQRRTVVDLDGTRQRIKEYEGRGNLFSDMAEGIKERDIDLQQKVGQYEAQFLSAERVKAWSTGNLEAVDLVLPDIQAALPFLAAAAKVVNLCRELRTSAPSVEFPVYKSPLTVDVVADTVTKPASDPTFDLITSRIYTIAGTTQVPNPTLEDYPVARGWISTELGRATGVKEDQLVLQGTGTGQPTGILNNGLITGRDAKDVNGDGKITGRDVIDATFRGIQDVRTLGFTEPTDIVMNPGVWTDIVLAFETNVGYLYGPPQNEGPADSGPPRGEPNARLLGLPVTQDAYVTTTYGATTNTSPVIVGDFNDAIVLRRSPFRVDVDVSLGFLNNTTWFRGEERMGFVVVRPASFKVITNIKPGG